MVHLYFSISLTLSCPMNLKLFPLDNQTCSLQMGSCKYTFHLKVLAGILSLRLGSALVSLSCFAFDVLTKSQHLPVLCYDFISDNIALADYTDELIIQ